MKQYFLKDGKNEIGPLTIEQLKLRPVNKNTPVWFAGLEEWTTVEQVYELKELLATKSSASLPSLNKFWTKLFKKSSPKTSYQLALSKERNNIKLK